jgi:hypothetical protein
MIASPEQPPNPEEHSNAHSFRLVALAVPAWLAKDSWTSIKYYFGFRFRTALRQTDGGPRVTVNNRDTKGRGLMSPKAYETLAALLLIICVPVVCDCSAEEPSEPAKTVAVEVKSPGVQADVSPARTRHIPKASELVDFLRKQRVQDVGGRYRQQMSGPKVVPAVARRKPIVYRSLRRCDRPTPTKTEFQRLLKTDPVAARQILERCKINVRSISPLRQLPAGTRQLPVDTRQRATGTWGR